MTIITERCVIRSSNPHETAKAFQALDLLPEAGARITRIWTFTDRIEIILVSERADPCVQIACDDPRIWLEDDELTENETLAEAEWAGRDVCYEEVNV